MPSRTDRVRVRVSDSVADVRLVRADKHNGFDLAMLEDLHEAIDEIGADEGVRVVVLSGEGPSFSAGLDFKSFMAGPVGVWARLGGRRAGEAENFVQRSTLGWRALPVPVIAALHGACFGAGFQLALAADLRIAAPDIRMAVMEIRYGLIPDMGISQTLPRLVRDDVARELVYTGRMVESQEARALGLVTTVTADPRAAAFELAAELAAKSPEAIRSAKRLLGEGPGAGTAAGLALEADLQRALLSTLLETPLTSA